jgi:hypothetical protein
MNQSKVRDYRAKRFSKELVTSAHKRRQALRKKAERVAENRFLDGKQTFDKAMERVYIICI